MEGFNSFAKSHPEWELDRLRRRREFFVTLGDRFRDLGKPEMAEHMYRSADITENMSRPVARHLLKGVAPVVGEVNPPGISEVRVLAQPASGIRGIIPSESLIGALGDEPAVLAGLARDEVAEFTREELADDMARRPWSDRLPTRGLIAKQLSRDPNSPMSPESVEAYLGLDKPDPYVNPNAPTGRRLGPSPKQGAPLNSNIETVLRKPLQLQIPEAQLGRRPQTPASDLTTNRFWNQFGAFEEGGAATIPRTPAPRSPVIGELPTGRPLPPYAVEFPGARRVYMGQPPAAHRMGQQLLDFPPPSRAPAASMPSRNSPLATPMSKASSSTAFKESFSTREIRQMREAVTPSSSGAFQRSNHGPYLRNVITGTIDTSATGHLIGPKWLAQLTPKIHRFIQSFSSKALQAILKMPK